MNENTEDKKQADTDANVGVQPVVRFPDHVKCKNCKHWIEGGKDDYERIIDSGICKKAAQFWEVTEWREVEEPTHSAERKIKPEYSDNGVFVRDGSDYYAILVTQPNFGCVKFEGI